MAFSLPNVLTDTLSPIELAHTFIFRGSPVANCVLFIVLHSISLTRSSIHIALFALSTQVNIKNKRYVKKTFLNCIIKKAYMGYLEF